MIGSNKPDHDQAIDPAMPILIFISMNFRLILRITWLSVLLGPLSGHADAVASPAATATQVRMRTVFDWQIQHLWSTAQPVEHRWGTRGWVHGAFLTGVMEAYRATSDTAYVDYAIAMAERNSWQLGPRLEHADDYIVGQTYLELHLLHPDAAPIAATQARVDELIAAQPAACKIWWWCDALYMAPPTFAKLAQVTGDPHYLDVMDRWYWETYAALFDPAEHLFYRDERFVNPADGNKVFWSRGNGWVLAGLARMLDVLPADHPSRGRYVDLFKQMAARMVQLQPADGLWRANLLQPEAAHGEASGSAFFCYALAWGINHNFLPAADFRPAVDRAWTALIACVGDDGRLGWVQPIGSAPDAYDATTWQEYGSGAFLAAGAQMLQLP